MLSIRAGGTASENTGGFRRHNFKAASRGEDKVVEGKKVVEVRTRNGKGP